MPIVTVQMYEGRTVEQKRALATALTQAMVDIAKTTPEQVHVIIQDVPRTNWAQSGKLASDS
ncbi:MAG TPA: 4-oxalocrotonate tautomerase [Chloroflexota bacterium]|nr:4-oxalocrotonate tautomerase [Chloroflexota bacterium]